MSVERDRGAAANAAHAEAARQRLGRTARYLRRGRGYAEVSDDALVTIWLTAMRDWACVPDRRPVAVDDAEAEFDLRDHDPPHPLARDEIGRLAAAALDGVASLTDDERCALGERILERHRGERTRGC